MEKIRVGVINSNALSREGLASLLTGMGFGSVQGAAGVQDLKQLADGHPMPDVVLVDLSRSVGDVIATMNAIKVWSPTTKVVFLLQELDVELLGACFGAGAFGYLLKDISRAALEETLKLVCAGEKVFPSSLALQMGALASKFGDRTHTLAQLRAGGLSEREIDILRCLVIGHGNKTIAANLNIAELTVKVHLKRILRKTHACNRTQAAIWALEHGLIGQVELDRSA